MPKKKETSIWKNNGSDVTTIPKNLPDGVTRIIKQDKKVIWDF